MNHVVGYDNRPMRLGRAQPAHAMRHNAKHQLRAHAKDAREACFRNAPDCWMQR
jgi:hypothetical protein